MKKHFSSVVKGFHRRKKTFFLDGESPSLRTIAMGCYRLGLYVGYFTYFKITDVFF